MKKPKHAAKAMPRPRPPEWSAPLQQVRVVVPQQRRPTLEERLHRYVAAKRANGGETPYDY